MLDLLGEYKKWKWEMREGHYCLLAIDRSFPSYESLCWYVDYVLLFERKRREAKN